MIGRASRTVPRHVMCLLSVILLLGSGLGPAVGQQGIESGKELENGFHRPPPAARPSAYWLWLNGYANRDYFDTELRSFAEQGVGGLCIFDMGARGDAKFFPPTGPAFMSDESIETIAHALGGRETIWIGCPIGGLQ